MRIVRVAGRKSSGNVLRFGYARPVGASAGRRCGETLTATEVSMTALATRLGDCLKAMILCLSYLGASAAAAADWSLYQDARGPGWDNWSWKPSNPDFAQTQVRFKGERAIAVDLERDGGLSLHHQAFGTGPWESLAFHIHGGNIGGQVLRVAWEDNQGRRGGVALNDPRYIEGGALAAGRWQSVGIPLRDLGADNRVVTRFNIENASAEDPAPFYVDDMRLVAAAAPRPFVIEADAGHGLGTLSRELFGSNAAWWNDSLAQDQDAIAKLSAAGLTLLRFPGGSDADRYNWKIYEAPTLAEPWSTNTSEFLEILAKTSAGGMMTVNFGSGTAQEAADWVRFINLTHHGQVRYWEVGNEIYGNWEESWTHDPVEYVEGNATHAGFNAFCAAMKAVDPSILVGAVGKAPYQWSEHDNWLPAVLTHTGDCLDFLSIHYYRWGQADSDPYALLSDPPASWPVQVSGLRETLATYGRGRDIRLFVTEHNSYYGSTDAPPAPLAAQTVNMLYLADTLGQLATQGILVANHWNVRTEAGGSAAEYWGMLLASEGNRRQPSYYAFPIWRRAGDQRIAVTTNLDPSTEMTVYGTRHSFSGNLTLIVVNKAQARSGTVSIAGFQPAGTVAAVQVYGSGLNDPLVRYNGLSDAEIPVDLSLVAPIVASIPAASFQYTFPGYSITALTIFVRRPFCTGCLPSRGGWRATLAPR
jgi:alpha-L-arabinofuranosidase